MEWKWNTEPWPQFIDPTLKFIYTDEIDGWAHKELTNQQNAHLGTDIKCRAWNVLADYVNSVGVQTHHNLRQYKLITNGQWIIVLCGKPLKTGGDD